MPLTNEAHEFLKRFRPASDVWNNMPVLYKQVMREKVRSAPCSDLRRACQLCNTNITGLMDILGI